MKKIYTILLASALLVGVSNAQTGTWTSITSGTSTNLLGVSAPSATTVYVCGLSGLIRKSTDAGTSWTTQASLTTQTLYDIAFSDANNGIVVGDNGTARRTTNGGATWTAISIPTSQNLRGIVYTSPSVAYISSGTASGLPGQIHITTDGGINWTLLTTSPAATDAIYQTFFSSATDGYAVDFDGNVIKTTTAGASWIALTSGVTSALAWIHFTSTTNGVFGGTGVIRRTTDGGSTWTSVAPGTTDYLSNIDFSTSSYGVIAAGSATVGSILTTTDGGATWSISYPGTPRLINIDFFNVNLGYMVGFSGTILKYTNTVGINENEGFLSNLRSYPNPFSTSTTIDCSNYLFDASPMVKIYDVTGKIVRDFTSTDKKQIIIEKGDLNAGMYFYKVLDGNKMVGTGKMIVR